MVRCAPGDAVEAATGSASAVEAEAGGGGEAIQPRPTRAGPSAGPRADHLAFVLSACSISGAPPMSSSVVLPAPGPAPRSAPVVGLAAASDCNRSATFLATAASVRESLTLAVPSPSSAGITCSRSSTRSHCSPVFQGPVASPSPCEVLMYMSANGVIPRSLPDGKLSVIEYSAFSNDF